MARKYGGLEVSDTKRLKAPEEENRRLKRVVADQALNLQVLKDVLGIEW
jgi:putative transposase